MRTVWELYMNYMGTLHELYMNYTLIPQGFAQGFCPPNFLSRLNYIMAVFSDQEAQLVRCDVPI